MGKKLTKKEKAKEKAELARFGEHWVMKRPQVIKKILKKEEPPDEKKIFDFSFTPGGEVKMGKKEKKKASDQGLQMSFYNIRSKRYNPLK